MRQDAYYDFTVNEHHNYLLAGVFHHNTGKTLISQAICQGHSAHRGYRALVFAPPHLIWKWEREILQTLTNAHVHHLRSYHDIVNVMRGAKPVGRGWWIVSNTRAKMGAKWRPAYVTRNGNRRCPQCDGRLTRYDAKLQMDVALTHEELEKKKLFCTNSVEQPDGSLRPCNAALWTYTHEIDRWPIADFVHRHLRNWFDYLVIDESHVCKSPSTAVGQAMGTLSAACRKTICLTGTMFGGFANHAFPLLYRIAPQSLVEEGIGWGEDMKFSERYGRLERRVTETSTGGRDNRQSKGSTTKTAKYVRPGVMPTLFGRHLIGSTIFLSLDEVAEALPKLEETVLPIEMDAETQAAYKEIEDAITAEIKQMLARKDKRLLSKMLHVLLGYPDHPYDWKEIGYWDHDDDGGSFWHPVVTPKNLSRSVLRPKEKALIELVKAELAQGRKCWVYSVMTEARDVNERLRSILADAGLRVEVLRASVPTDEREEWIAKKAPGLDVIVSHPALVETGLDFFAKQGDGYAYNIPTIIGYSWGYSTFTMRQAGRRHWRIGQSETCRTFHVHYGETMQARALSLMGKKLVASTSIEGKFTSEGLAALAGDEGTLETALAKSLVERLEDTDCGRIWAKLGGAQPSIEQLTESSATEQISLKNADGLSIPKLTPNEPAEFELPPPKHVFQPQFSF